MIWKKDMLQNEEILRPIFGDPPNIGLAWCIHFIYINPAMPEKIPYILVSHFFDFWFSFKELPPDIFELREFLTDLSIHVAITVDNMLSYEQLKSTSENLEREKHFLQDNAWRIKLSPPALIPLSRDGLMSI